MNLCANVFVFGGFNVHRKGWITCSGETLWFFYLKWPYSDDRLFYLDPTLWLSVWLFWIYFFWCKYQFYDGIPSIGRFWSCLSFHWLSFTLKRGDPFHRTAYDFSLLIGMVFVIIREMFNETISLNTMFLVLVVCPVNGSSLQLLWKCEPELSYILTELFNMC